MSSLSRARCVAGAVVAFAMAMGATLPSEAASKSKPRKHIFDDLVTPSMLAALSEPSVRAPQASGARFFSINSVLARIDGKTPPNEPVRLASITTDDVASDAPADVIPAEPTAQKTAEPFGLFAFRAPEGALWRKWRSVKNDIAREMASAMDCKADISTCEGATRRFLLMAGEVQGYEGAARLEVANRLINTAIRYTSDLIQHGDVDVWSAPLASLKSGRGDCEDYAIAKYVLLREAGVAEQDMRILLVRDRAARQDHAVLAVRKDKGWTVLDNRSAMLFSEDDLPQFTPLAALDTSGVSLFASPYLTQRMNLDGKTPAPAASSLEETNSSADILIDDIATLSSPTADDLSTSTFGISTLPLLM